MYRINLYPEYRFRRRQARVRIFRLGLQASLMGMVMLVIGSLTLSALLLNEKARDVGNRISTQAQRLEIQGDPADALALANEIVELRGQRIDWAPKLAALSETIDGDLLLVEFKGNAPDRGKPSHLEMWGEALKDEVQVGVFSSFVDSLRADQRLVADFPGLRLGGIQDGKRTRFQVLWTPEQGGSS